MAFILKVVDEPRFLIPLLLDEDFATLLERLLWKVEEDGLDVSMVSLRQLDGEGCFMPTVAAVAVVASMVRLRLPDGLCLEVRYDTGCCPAGAFSTVSLRPVGVRAVAVCEFDGGVPVARVGTSTA